MLICKQLFVNFSKNNIIYFFIELFIVVFMIFFFFYIGFSITGNYTLYFRLKWADLTPDKLAELLSQDRCFINSGEIDMLLLMPLERSYDLDYSTEWIFPKNEDRLYYFDVFGSTKFYNMGIIDDYKNSCRCCFDLKNGYFKKQINLLDLSIKYLSNLDYFFGIDIDSKYYSKAYNWKYKVLNFSNSFDGKLKYAFEDSRCLLNNQASYFLQIDFVKKYGSGVLSPNADYLVREFLSLFLEQDKVDSSIVIINNI